MQVLKATRKVYMSILTVVLLLTTSFATTFAWVGILTYSELENFELNLKVEDISKDYSLLVSTNEHGPFREEINMSDVKMQIMNNLGVDTSKLETPSSINSAFNIVSIAPVTSTRVGNELVNWQTFSNVDKNFFPSNDYFKFDLYFSVDRKDKGDNADDSNVDVPSGIIFMASNDSMVGEKCTIAVINGITYPSEDTIFNDITLSHPGFDIYDQSVTIDSSYATRLAIQVYDPIDISSEYSSEDLANSLYIYEKGGLIPSYNETTNTYSFGGILPEEYNLAFQEFKSIYNFGGWFTIPYEAYERGDKEIGGNQVLVSEEDGTFGITNGVANKVKISVYFWYEGWDSDCINALAGTRTTINLSFSASENKQEENE